MPSSVGSAFLWLGLILALAGAPVPAVTVGAVGLLWELYLFYRSGT